MCTRNKTKGSPGQSVPSVEGSIQLATSYVREFSAKARLLAFAKSEDALAQFHRSTSLLTTVSPQHFNPTHLEISKFFIDLHAVIGELAPELDALWACVALLQHCCRNLEARRAIVDEFRFVPLLSFVLKKTQAQDKVTRLLTLLQELTFGIRISWEEPYMAVLLQHLVTIVYCNAENGDETNSLLALSILINLCYKNFVIKLLFLRSANISAFSRKIQSYGMLASKMLIILSEDIHAPNQKQLHAFLHSTFASISTCIKHWNVPHLRHIVEFLMDSKAYTGLHLAMLSFEGYCDDIERLLNELEDRCKMDDSDEDKRKLQSICMGLIFQLLHYVFQLCSLPNAIYSENTISLESNMPRIFGLLCNWLSSEVCGHDAIQLLDGLIILAKKETLAPRLARDPSVVVELIAISISKEANASHVTAILRLLQTLLQQSKTESLILSKITVGYFNQILEPLLRHTPEMPADFFSATDIEKYTFCLLLLTHFASSANTVFGNLCCDLFQRLAVQYALARAMLSGNKEVCNAVFQMSRAEHFPQSEVSQQICVLRTNSYSRQPQNTNDDHWRDLNVMLKYHKSFVNKEVEQRLQALVDVISEAQQSNQLSNVATSQMIELFNYKTDQFQHTEHSMQKRLDQASQELTNMTQRINLQNAELHKYHAMNFELHVNMESLQTQCNDLTEQKNNIKCNMTEQLKLLSEQKKLLQITEKQLSVKTADMITSQKEHEIIKEQLTAELEKLRHTTKENMGRIDKLKNSISAYELDIKEKQRCIEDKERELSKVQKALDEQREARKKSDDVIAVLETQLQEKNDMIHNYEVELNESEQVRKAIMSLMGSKKAKRGEN